MNKLIIVSNLLLPCPMGQVQVKVKLDESYLLGMTSFRRAYLESRSVEDFDQIESAISCAIESILPVLKSELITERSIGQIISVLRGGRLDAQKANLGVSGATSAAHVKFDIKKQAKRVCYE